MNKEKLTYEAPEAETLVIRFEGNVLQVASPLMGINDWEDDGDPLSC